MTSGAFVLGPTRVAIPLLAMFACLALIESGAGDGVGLRSGLVFALALTLHLIVFGARAAERAFPAALARAMLGLGVLATMFAWSAPASAMMSRVGEGGLFLATAAATPMILRVFVGRAPTLRDVS